MRTIEFRRFDGACWDTSKPIWIVEGTHGFWNGTKFADGVEYAKLFSDRPSAEADAKAAFPRNLASEACQRIRQLERHELTQLENLLIKVDSASVKMLSRQELQ